MHRAVAPPQDHPRVRSAGRHAAAGLVRVEHHAVVQRHAQLEDRGVAAQVLVGQEQHLCRPSPKAHSSAACALEEVQTMPPCRPQKALMSAEEFM